MTPGTNTTATWVPEVGKPYEYETFTPRTLGERIPDRWSAETATLLDEALSRLGELSPESDLAGLSVHLGRAEAGGSSMIEGYSSGARRLFEHRFDPEANTDTRVRPVLHNWRLMERVRNENDLSVDTILGWHELLMAHDPRSRPGEIRQTQNWIGNDPYGPHDAAYVPPPPDAVPELLDELVSYALTSGDQPVVRAAALHVQFESIHPFADGNGRVGRALIHWALRNHAPSVPPLALVWYGHRDRYFSMLDEWRRRADPEPWMTYFATSLLDAIEAAQRLLADLETLPTRWREQAPARAGSLQRRLIEDLVANPIVDIDSARERLDATPSGFSRAARSLEAAGVLTPTSLARRRRGHPRKVYEARDVFRTLDEFIASFR